MWRLSGIERDVYLYSTPKQYIADYKLNASLEKEKYKDGIFGLEVTVEGHSAISGATSIAYTLSLIHISQHSTTLRPFQSAGTLKVRR